MTKKLIVSGMRPTGNIHLGNYFGALENWVSLQDDYKCFFFIADWHALTTGYDDTSQLKENVYQLLADYLACGLDPEKSVIFLQSEVKAHAELHLLLSMIVPLSWLERCPTYKDQIANLTGKDIMTYGFLGYPNLMTSDVLIYNANFVPVGEDQVPHLEIAREIARRANYIFGKDIFVEPQPLLTKSKVLPGTDGRKMSKSYNNTIAFSDTPEEVGKKVMSMKTDPEKIRKNDPGHPEVCTVFAFHKIFSPDEVDETDRTCRDGSLGCVQCKKNLCGKLSEFHTPIHEKRNKYLQDKCLLDEILKKGTEKAENSAKKVMNDVRKAFNIGLCNE